MRPPSKPWFAPKRYGYGAGLPIAWQGWLVLAIYIAVVGSTCLLPFIISNPGLQLGATVVIVTLASLILLVICVKKTRGGWRWRWGGKD